MLTYPILFEDASILVLAKPAGLMVEKDPHANPSVEGDVISYLKQKRVPQNTIVGIVHRLDRPVSGVVLIAKKKSVLRELNKQFEEGQVEKVYFAIVSPQPEKKEAHLQHYLRKDNRLQQAIIYKNKKANTAKCELIYKVLRTDGSRSLLEIHPLTGKYHQIRAQLSFIGCPIIGDTKYGSKINYRKEAICLHAHSLEFFHPVEKKKMKITCAPPDDWQLKPV